MNATSVVKQLQKLYPDKSIFNNIENDPTEIICEIEPSSKHPEYSVAIAIIDTSNPHYHNLTTEVYEVVKGVLILNLDGKEITLQKGESITIQSGVLHFAKGKETWVKATSHPGWTVSDHFNSDT